jgi:hypothetical protein
MGDACRTKGERTRQFALAVATVRRCLPQSGTVLGPSMGGGMGSTVPSGPLPPGSTACPPADTFWEQYQATCAQEAAALLSTITCPESCVTISTNTASGPGTTSSGSSRGGNEKFRTPRSASGSRSRGRSTLRLRLPK